MYEFSKNGVTLTCGACLNQTPVWTSTPVRIGDAPKFARVETGRWDFSEDCAETRLLKFARTETVDGCPTCAAQLAAQKRAGGPAHLPRPTTTTPKATRPVETYMTAMPRLVKHRKVATP